MAAMSNYLENALVDHILRGQAFSATTPGSVYVALYTAAPSDAGGGTEVTGNAYARAEIARTLANWAGTQGPGTTAASSGVGGQTSNNVAIGFPTPTGSWGTVTHFAVFDAVTGGNMLFHGSLSVPQTIMAGNAVSWPAGQFLVTFG